MVYARHLLIFHILIILLSNGITLAEEKSESQDISTEPILSFTDIVIVSPDEELFNRLQKETGFISVIETETITSPITDTTDILDNVVGVNASQYGGLGMFSFISIRGSEANQVSYYLNGIPLNSGSTGYFNLASIPLGFLDHIEIYRGWSPPSLGQPALGGAVNFVTKKNLTHSRGRFSLSMGSFETYQSSLSTQLGNDKSNLLIYGNHLQSQGNFKYVNDLGTPNNRSDDEIVTRSNAQFSSNEFLLNYVRQQSETFEFTILGTYQTKSQGMPGNATIQTENTHLDEIIILFELSSSIFECIRQDDEFSFQLFNHTLSSDFSDPDGELSFLTEKSESRVNRAGLRLKYVASALTYNLLTFTTGYTWESNATTNDVRGIFIPGTLKKIRSKYYFSIDNKITVFNNTLQIRPNIRLDGIRNKKLSTNDNQTYHNYDNPDTSWSFISPQLALQWFIRPQLSFKTSVGFYSRYPSLDELYGDRGTTAGNPSLEPETGINRDIGFQWHGEYNNSFQYFLEYAYFDKESEDLVVHVQNSQYTFRPENIGAARIRGNELHTSALVNEMFSLSVNYTYQEAKDTSELPYYRGNYLPQRPMHELSSNITFFIEPVSFHYDTTYQSHNYLDRANQKDVSDRLIHNISFEWKNIIDGLTWLFEMRNISDNQIEDIAGYPLPGRSFYFSLHYNFPF